MLKSNSRHFIDPNEDEDEWEDQNDESEDANTDRQSVTVTSEIPKKNELEALIDEERKRQIHGINTSILY